jgi:PD-(D/E)XK nuclease superfamily
VSVRETPITLLTPSPPSDGPSPDPEAYATETALRSLISLASVTSARSRQVPLGASEIGDPCDRKLAYRMARVRPSNLTDPLPALVGTGVHSVMADLFGTLDAGAGRFLVEERVMYRGVPGTVDLYDRLTHVVIDWKTTTLAKLKRIRHEGPPSRYVTQVHVYAAALVASGEDPFTVAIAYLPVDGTLADMWVWQTPFDRDVADAARERIARIRVPELTSTSGGVIDPATVTPTPSALCPWCPYHQRSATDLSTACSGKDATP